MKLVRAIDTRKNESWLASKNLMGPLKLNHKAKQPTASGSGPVSSQVIRLFGQFCVLSLGWWRPYFPIHCGVAPYGHG